MTVSVESFETGTLTCIAKVRRKSSAHIMLQYVALTIVVANRPGQEPLVDTGPEEEYNLVSVQVGKVNCESQPYELKIHGDLCHLFSILCFCFRSQLVLA